MSERVSAVAAAADARRTRASRRTRGASIPFRCAKIGEMCIGLLVTSLLLSMPDATELQKNAARFATVDVDPDVSALPASERTALVKVIEAARLMDALFLRQVWAGN